MEWIIQVSSVTNAMRGKALLEQHGYKVIVQRDTDSQGRNGCGYSLRVQGDGALAEMLLRGAAVRVLGREAV